MSWKTAPQFWTCSSKTSVCIADVGPSDDRMVSLSWQSAADDDLRRRPADSRRPGKLIVCTCRERLAEMREAYVREAELSPTSPAPTVDCVTSSDPFYDRFPWFRLVARSVQYTRQHALRLRTLPLDPSSTTLHYVATNRTTSRRVKMFCICCILSSLTCMLPYFDLSCLFVDDKSN